MSQNLHKNSAEKSADASVAMHCFHCGEPCNTATFAALGKLFCCQGCLTVFELLTENGLGNFYRLSETAGVKIKGAVNQAHFAYLDDSKVRERIVNFSNDRITHVTFRTPAMHCVACVWLLENLFRLKPGIGQSQVNFPRKEVAISFDPGKIQLS